MRPGTGSVHRAGLKTRTTGRSATAAETKDPQPKSHRKASTWPAYSAPPQNHPPTHQPKTKQHPAGKTPPKTHQRKRRTRRVRRARRERTKTTKRPNRSKRNLSSRKRLSHLRVWLQATISEARNHLSY